LNGQAVAVDATTIEAGKLDGLMSHTYL